MKATTLEHRHALCRLRVTGIVIAQVTLERSIQVAASSDSSYMGCGSQHSAAFLSSDGQTTADESAEREARQTRESHMSTMALSRNDMRRLQVRQGVQIGEHDDRDAITRKMFRGTGHTSARDHSQSFWSNDKSMKNGIEKRRNFSTKTHTSNLAGVETPKRLSASSVRLRHVLIHLRSMQDAHPENRNATGTVLPSMKKHRSSPLDRSNMRKQRRSSVQP